MVKLVLEEKYLLALVLLEVAICLLIELLRQH
jgi:hypothetical protein